MTAGLRARAHVRTPRQGSQLPTADQAAPAGRRLSSALLHNTLSCRSRRARLSWSAATACRTSVPNP